MTVAMQERLFDERITIDAPSLKLPKGARDLMYGYPVISVRDFTRFALGVRE